MGRVLKEGELEFDFTSAFNAEYFDDDRHGMSHCMKAVDFLVEWEAEFWFIEVKDPAYSRIPIKYKTAQRAEFIAKIKSGYLFSNELGPKIKDSFLYLYLGKNLPAKTLKYYVLLSLETLDPRMLHTSITELSKASCLLGPAQSTWKNQYIDAVAVFNQETWNKKLPQCPVKRKR